VLAKHGNSLNPKLNIIRFSGQIKVPEGNAAYLSTISALPSLRGTTQSFTEWRYAAKDRRATARDDVVLLLFLLK
jgi:hypothetical protein